MSDTILVLGAASAIAAAYCRRRAEGGASFVLVGRNRARLDAIAADLKGRGGSKAVAVEADLVDTADADQRFGEFCAALGQPDQVVLAYGVLGDQAKAEDDPEETRRIIDVNFTSAAVWLQMAAKHLSQDKPRVLVVIGSVAGDRGRRSNYVYGAAKAGLDAFAEGLAHRLHGSPLRVLTVKPGPTETPMTAGFSNRTGPMWAKPEQVAADIDKAVRSGARVVYTPRRWGLIMTAIRMAPRALFYRTKL